MVAHCHVYDSRQLQADCKEPGSTPKPYARYLSMGHLYLFAFYLLSENISAKAVLCSLTLGQLPLSAPSPLLTLLHMHNHFLENQTQLTDSWEKVHCSLNSSYSIQSMTLSSSCRCFQLLWLSLQPNTSSVARRLILSVKHSRENLLCFFLQST